MKQTLTEKWNKQLISENFPSLNESQNLTMAMIMDNTDREEVQRINERTEASDIAQFTPILIPLVRRVYPSLIANKLVGVQALKTPTAYLYALVYKYTGTSDNGINPADKAQIISVDTPVAIGDTLTGDVSTAAGEVIYVENGGLTALVKITNGILFQAESIDTGAAAVLATWTNEAQFQKVLTDYTGPYATSVAEDLSTDMKEVGFDIERTMVEAKSRKLKGKYTLEMYEDLKAMHGVDAAKEIMDLMSLEMNWEIDRQVVNFTNGTVNAGADANINGYSGRWEVEKYRSLGIKIANDARRVGQLIRRGSANTMLVSPKSAVALEAMGSFTISTIDSQVNSVNSGVNPNVGKFDKRYDVVVDNFNDADEYVNVFYKGDSSKDALGFLAPYSTGLVKTTNPESGQPAVIISNRYGLAKNPLNPENYGIKSTVNFTDTVLA
jgi:hypothetical protein